MSGIAASDPDVSRGVEHQPLALDQHHQLPRANGGKPQLLGTVFERLDDPPGEVLWREETPQPDVGVEEQPHDRCASQSFLETTETSVDESGKQKPWATSIGTPEASNVHAHRRRPRAQRPSISLTSRRIAGRTCGIRRS